VLIPPAKVFHLQTIALKQKQQHWMLLIKYHSTTIWHSFSTIILCVCVCVCVV